MNIRYKLVAPLALALAPLVLSACSQGNAQQDEMAGLRSEITEVRGIALEAEATAAAALAEAQAASAAAESAAADAATASEKADRIFRAGLRK